MDEYESDKWRLIAAKVGTGFSPLACQEKAEDLEIEDEFGDTMSTDSPATTSAHMQRYTSRNLSSDSLPARSGPAQQQHDRS
jgi:hypothetical protein